jgi:beta-1,4-mannosyl-glycoprotein beta-1,4-N-acetylglucosaminyltransferase
MRRHSRCTPQADLVSASDQSGCRYERADFDERASGTLHFSWQQPNAYLVLERNGILRTPAKEMVGYAMSNVFDCFTFFNELDLLEIRLYEHSPIVSRFVIAEATRTHTGYPKPLYFQENRNRFAPFLDRITHIVVDDLPLGGVLEVDNIRREIHQRNALARGLAAARSDDYVIVSDVDEIICADALRKVVRRPGIVPAVHLFELRWFYYFLNYERPQRWLGSGPRMVKMRRFSTPQALREIRPLDDRPIFRRRLRRMRRTYGRTMDYTIHRNAGWHFSYMGGIDAIIHKLDSYTHVHPDAFKERSYIKQCIAEGRSYDPADIGNLELRIIDNSFPEYLKRNVEKYRALIADERLLGQLR